MTTITIQNLDDETMQKLSWMAEANGHSVEDEARDILVHAVYEFTLKGLGTLIAQEFEAIGGVQLELPVRSFPSISNYFVTVWNFKIICIYNLFRYVVRAFYQRSPYLFSINITCNADHLVALSVSPKTKIASPALNRLYIAYDFPCGSFKNRNIFTVA